MPVHLQPGTASYGGDGLDLPGTMDAARTNLALPMGTGLSNEDLKAVVEAVRTAVGALD